ncbi:MAG: hypothetical protein PHS92_00485 [Candidatus Gracilibacteria bacterium]|nr:hypothetical protein [Candidatus Gracilibacteria bacterium]
MKKLSILISIGLITATFFYSLDIISENNACTSVRKYDCLKRGISQQDLKATDSSSQTTIDEKLKNDLLGASDLFIKGYDTVFAKIDSQADFYKVIYSGKDNIEVDIVKDSNWIQSVTINSKSLSRDEINGFFKK